MIIFPAVDIRGGKCVRLLQGDYKKETVYSDFPEQEALRWQDEGAWFLHLVDLDGAKEGDLTNLETVRRICKALSIPCELGGGVRNIEAAEKILEAGVSRVILGTAACENPSLVKDIIEKFGSEKVVVGIDAKGGKVAVRGWLESSDVGAVELAEKMCAAGVKRIIYTDISTDGMLSGPNLKAIDEICGKIPQCGIIASGGVSSAEDIINLKALKKSNLEGVIVGKALYDGRVTLKELLKAAGD